MNKLWERWSAAYDRLRALERRYRDQLIGGHPDVDETRTELNAARQEEQKLSREIQDAEKRAEAARAAKRAKLVEEYMAAVRETQAALDRLGPAVRKLEAASNEIYKLDNAGRPYHIGVTYSEHFSWRNLRLRFRDALGAALEGTGLNSLVPRPPFLYSRRSLLDAELAAQHSNAKEKAS